MHSSRFFDAFLLAVGLAFGAIGISWNPSWDRLAAGLWNSHGSAAWAAAERSFTPFTSDAFAAAQRRGQPVLVYISASWCPTCSVQRPVLNELVESPEFNDLQLFQIDFDTQKNLVRAMGAQLQSTLIVFRGTQEKGRLVGDTDRDAIKALIEKAYQQAK